MFACAVLAGCTRPATRTPPAVTADSLVLERTLCFGTCPAYRLSITRDGLVSFRSRNPGDSTVASARVSPDAFTQLVVEAERAGLRTLPPNIRADRTLCPLDHTDAPTVSTTLFAGGAVTRVERYTGCAVSGGTVASALHPALVRLREFETRVDSVAGSARWVRPASRR